MGTTSGIVCFMLFQAAYWLTTRLARSLPALRDISEQERSFLQQPGPVKWIGAALVLLIALAATYAWDQIRVRYQLDARKYWTMIGLALSICLLAALLSGGFR